jgi:hypothetical protein
MISRSVKTSHLPFGRSGLVRAAFLLAAAGLLAGCSSSTPVVSTTSSLPANTTTYSTAPARVATGAPRHVVERSGCAAWVSQAECRRIHAEGERMLRATCPAGDARCSGVQVVAARRIDARTTELTVRDKNTGKQTKRRVELETSAAAAQ